MLNDIFARRYDRIQLRDSFEQRDQRLLVQSFRILADDIYPYYVDGKEASWNVAAWKKLHAQLSRELGLRELSKQSVSYTAKWNGKDTLQTSAYTMLQVCENWFMEPVAGSPDTHIKERLSLIELAFREREAAIAAKEARPINDVEKLLVSLNRQVGKLPGDHDQAVRELREERRAEFRAWVEELNTRFRQADYPF
ncbi:MAG: hypothetical protein Q8O63_14250, partial [Hoeflea sp.]|nr:hypothetical protein [Hoeflea sp.]